MFTGRNYDSETGLYYYRARYYSSYIGRFLQTDPVGYAGGLNLYTYVGNNPLNWIDPFGLESLDEEEPHHMFLYGGSITGGAAWGGTFGVQNIFGTDLAFVHAGGGGYGGIGVSATVDFSYARGSLNNLNGIFATSGGSMAVPYPGGPFSIGLEGCVGDTHGGTLSVGIGASVAPAELHGFVERGWVVRRSIVPHFIRQTIPRNQMINDLLENGLDADILKPKPK